MFFLLNEIAGLTGRFTYRCRRITAGRTHTTDGDRMILGLSSTRSALPVNRRITALRAVQTWRGSKELFSTSTLSVSIEWGVFVSGV